MRKISMTLGLVILASCVSCVDETDAIRESASLYWRAILEGDYDTAYRILSRESRVRFSRTEFEESLGFVNFTDDVKLRKAWRKEADFVIEDIKQRGKQAWVVISFHVPDLDAIKESLNEEAVEKNIEKKTKQDTAKIAEWYNKRMTEEIRKQRFNRTVIDEETKLIREAGIWKVLFGE
ncbi:hypothetical protein JXM67_15445 [candidate division WOR-3 bacterium]|nr:hypothetical protein [candidate division WOR-3 bacterium]